MRGWELGRHGLLSNLAQKFGLKNIFCAKPADIAEQSPEAEKAYQDALDTLGKMVEANRKLKTPGITVEINRD